MNSKYLISLAVAVLSVPLSAQSVSTNVDLEPFVRRALPNCASPIQLTQEELKNPVPAGFVGKVFIAMSDSVGCSGRYAALLAPSGGFYFGSPWPISDLPGGVAEKIRGFALATFHENLVPTIGAQKNADGLLPVELSYTIEGGKVITPGWVDPAGTTYFPGVFYPSRGDIGKVRLEKLATILSASPSRGPADARVTIVEFSDFQCPSCKTAVGYMKPLLEKYGDQVRYIRVDFPLVQGHPWAFGAAVIGRAIHRLSPEVFWKFKDAVYENQANLNLFTLEDFARGFVSDHELNLDSFNTAIASEEIRKQILDSISLGQSLNIQGTPTFLVNGETVAAWPDGKHLAAVLEKALNAKASAASSN